MEARLAAFVMGTNDLAKDARAHRARPRPDAALVMKSRATVDILDGVYNDLGNAEGFARECAEARDMGFDGKTLVHPNQIEPCNAAFSPGADEVAQARKIHRLRPAGEQGQGRGPARWPHGRAAACRDGASRRWRSRVQEPGITQPDPRPAR